METKHNIIRRALEQAPGTQLPEGFCVRLMERLERESERRERRETWLLGTAGVLCLLAVIAGLAGLDLCLRRRRHNAAKTNAHPHR